MITPNLTLISYLGGSGGDWFTASANGHAVNLVNGAHANVDSLKPHEPDIKSGRIDIETVLGKYHSQYVSTHLFEHLAHLPHYTINVIIDNPDVQHWVVLRQMYLQRLRIMVAPHETFFVLVKNLCQKQKFEQAAHLWFVKASQAWMASMAARLHHTGPQLNFNCLFDVAFVRSVESQGWIQNIKLLKQNHEIWLTKNQNFSLDATLASMTSKLTSMPWQQEHGIIASQLC